MREKKITIISGSTVGYSHTDNYKNNQDSLKLFTRDIDGKKLIVGIVCDGCSSCLKAEVGANIFAQYLPKMIYRELIENAYTKDFFETCPGNVNFPGIAWDGLYLKSEMVKFQYLGRFINEVVTKYTTKKNAKLICIL